MPPSRRNLIVIVCLCVLTIFLAASVRVYNASSTSWSTLFKKSLPYAPYKVPEGPDAAFYEATNAGNTEKKPVPTPTSTLKPKPKPVPGLLEAPVVVSARAYVVGDLETGKIYYAKNGKQILPVASMSKLITAFAAVDTIAADALIEITPVEAELPADTSNLRVGEKIPMRTILYPLLLSSSNVAAEAIAAKSGNSQDFFELMSSYAWEIGMPGSFFADASGLNPQNAASAEDLLALAKYLYISRPDILSITRTPSITIATTSDHGSHEVVSTHPFVNDPDFIGGKTGRTPQAGETMMTIMRVKNKPVAIIVLGSQFGGREGDTRALLQKIQEKI